MCASEVRCEVLVSEAKPSGHSKCLDCFKAPEGLVDEAPAPKGVEFAGKCISDGINVGTDVQTPDIGIVTDIHNDVNLLFGNDLYKATQKLGGAGSTGKYGIVGGLHPIILRGPAARGRPGYWARSSEYHRFHARPPVIVPAVISRAGHVDEMMRHSYELFPESDIQNPNISHDRSRRPHHVRRRRRPKIP